MRLLDRSIVVPPPFKSLAPSHTLSTFWKELPAYSILRSTRQITLKCSPQPFTLRMRVTYLVLFYRHLLSFSPRLFSSQVALFFCGLLLPSNEARTSKAWCEEQGGATEALNRKSQLCSASDCLISPRLDLSSADALVTMASSAAAFVCYTRQAHKATAE